MTQIILIQDFDAQIMIPYLKQSKHTAYMPTQNFQNLPSKSGSWICNQDFGDIGSWPPEDKFNWGVVILLKMLHYMILMYHSGI